MLLYDSSTSGNCYKVRLLLAHLGRDYERRELDVVDRSNRAEVLGELNRALRVPRLYAYTHVAGEAGFELDRFPAIGAWLGRVSEQPGHVPIDA